MTEFIMPRVRGLTAQLHAKEGGHYEFDKFWAYRIEVYYIDGENKENIVMAFDSMQLIPSSTYYTQVEARRAVEQKADDIMRMMHKVGGAKDGSAFVIDLKDGGKLRRLGKKK